MADCALVNKDNLALLMQGEHDKPALKFISLLPENFGLNEEIKVEAFRLDSWQEIGKLSPKKDAACYQSQSFVWEIDGREYRLIVVHSTVSPGSYLPQKQEPFPVSPSGGSLSKVSGEKES